MSLRRKTNHKYNRMVSKEEEIFISNHWEDPGPYTRWDRDEEEIMRFWIDEMRYRGDGVCYNMGEYHGMYVLTLLRYLNIKTAQEVVNERGWNCL